ADMNIRSTPKYFIYLVIENGITKGILLQIYSTTSFIWRSISVDMSDIAADSDTRSNPSINRKII
ncbi:MAG: hypothetical protein P0116_16445, partial [Candidatus Nitrosocosmicus sp.]|nr:hypothetical protein [Candidatus Nitrosocosmicus sp.]